MTSDIVRIHCRSSEGDTFDKVLVGIAYKKQLHNFTGARNPHKMNLNVLLVGFDSISRMTAIRKYVKTRDYILNKLNGIELEGYNIVGDGTPQALIPILTGTTEIELPESRRGFKNARHVDGHPFIWKDYKKDGYITHFVEDLPPISIFNHRMVGFNHQPTDHYGRPYYLASESRVELYFPFCYKGSKKHNIFLKMFEDFFDMYPNKMKFGFGFHSEISHDDNNRIELFDEDVYLWLKSLEDKGHLNNTMLIFMSDHGARFSQFRATSQGKLEERMPFFTFTFPKWFEKVYPDAMQNFRINSKRLVTPFDIHATMYHMINYDGTGIGDVNNRGISLFREIPKHRTCAHAFVEPHWCACLDWQVVEANSPLLKRAIFVSISSINKWIQTASNQCHFLRISKITRSKQYHANSRMLKFKKSADNHGRIADLSSKTTYDETFYQITFITEPGSGLFEVTVRHNLKSNEMTIGLSDVSRTNAYGDDPKCIKDTLPHLERFCKCKT
ncbi:hypothetical protein LOTGIDRAFT_181204 [Lottia gigantea]|uniref:Sulfatase N-terminal domain-containing protein n=1 Tax=Lottia gigantea TaxID=225164 RepID=V4AMG6_LOTGI|nr:hypothetical protein LOTGIDRAFT_181204 [Lottia gigantea]ESP05359.1 hypothetical protein LOTGIDRAFT_181204 [Lottia gigantea]